MIKIIPVFFIVLYLQGCATFYTTSAAYEPEYAKIENITKAAECSDGAIYLYLQGKRIESAPTTTYIVSLPKDIVDKYAVSINTDFRKEDNPYLIQTIGRKVGDTFIHKFSYSTKAVQLTDQINNKNCIQKDIFPIQDPRICKSFTHDIEAFPLLLNSSATPPLIYTLQPCYPTDGMSIIIAPAGEGNYPLELAGGGTETLSKPQYFLLIPFSIAIDIVTSPLQLLGLLIEIGIHL